MEQHHQVARVNNESHENEKLANFEEWCLPLNWFRFRGNGFIKAILGILPEIFKTKLIYLALMYDGWNGKKSDTRPYDDENRHDIPFNVNVCVWDIK